jgi:hypothetical protein
MMSIPRWNAQTKANATAALENALVSMDMKELLVKELVAPILAVMQDFVTLNIN